MTEIKAPYNVFFGEDGYPLEGGFIFIGLDGLNPLSNPQQAYWDPALTIPAANVRTSGGRPSNNGVVGRLYVPGDYSILVQDKNGRTVYSQLSVAFENADLLVTESRGTLTRSARAPNSFNINNIVETGFYAWANGATTNQPPTSVAGNLFMLQVMSSPDGTGAQLQIITDLTAGHKTFMRQSTDSGTTWSAWAAFNNVVYESIAGDKTYTTAELNSDKLIFLTNAGAAAIDISAAAPAAGTRLTFVQYGAGTTRVIFGTGKEFTPARYTSQELIWNGVYWTAPEAPHGFVTFGPGDVSTTWRVPPGVRTIWLTGCGTGGVSGTAVSGGRGGGGGGSGAWCRRLELTVADGYEYAINLSTSGASTVVGGIHNISFGKGGNGSTSSTAAGSGGVGSGGASNGYAGGAGNSVSPFEGGGGGGIGGVGSTFIAAGGSGHGGGSGGAAVAGLGPGGCGAGQWLNGPGGMGSSNLTTGKTRTAAGPGGGGAGGAAGGSVALNAGGDGGLGGGGGGGSGNGAVGTQGGAGFPFLAIEW